MSSTHHICLSVNLGCSGLDPCAYCYRAILQYAVDHALEYAGVTNQQATLFKTGLVEGWQRLHGFLAEDPEMKVRNLDLSRVSIAPVAAAERQIDDQPFRAETPLRPEMAPFDDSEEPEGVVGAPDGLIPLSEIDPRIVESVLVQTAQAMQEIEASQTAASVGEPKPEDAPPLFRYPIDMPSTPDTPSRAAETVPAAASVQPKATAPITADEVAASIQPVAESGPENHGLNGRPRASS